MRESVVSIEERFWSKVDKSGSCWLWKGARQPEGYGTFFVRVTGRGQYWRAHRYAFVMSVGKIPPGMLVCHRCDNPSCVRPDHLFLGSPLDNMRDMIAKGRLVAPRRAATVCKRGHPLVSLGRQRGCRICIKQTRVTRALDAHFGRTL